MFEGTDCKTKFDDPTSGTYIGIYDCQPYIQQAPIQYQKTIHCWLDSTVALTLYWIKDRGEYREFVANRIHKTRQHENLVW